MAAKNIRPLPGRRTATHRAGFALCAGAAILIGASMTAPSGQAAPTTSQVSAQTQAANEAQYEISESRRDALSVNLYGATATATDGGPEIIGDDGDTLGFLPKFAHRGGEVFEFSYEVVNNTTVIATIGDASRSANAPVQYSYAECVGQTTVAGGAGGMAAGAVGGLLGGPAAPVTVTGGAGAGGLTGLAGGIVTGLIACV